MSRSFLYVVLLVCTFTEVHSRVYAGGGSILPRAYVPPHIPMTVVDPTPVFEVPWWLGGYVASVNESSNWTLPLTYPNGGRTSIGVTLVIQNRGPENITLYAQGNETVQGLGSYLVVAYSTVQLLSDTDWVVVSTTYGTEGMDGNYAYLQAQNASIQCWMGVGTNSPADQQCGDLTATKIISSATSDAAFHIDSDSATCGAGLVAGTALDTCMYRAAANAWTFNSGTSLRVPGYTCVGCTNAPNAPNAGVFTTDAIVMPRSNPSNVNPSSTWYPRWSGYEYTALPPVSNTYAYFQNEVGITLNSSSAVSSDMRFDSDFFTWTQTVNGGNFVRGKKLALLYGGTNNFTSGQTDAFCAFHSEIRTVGTGSIPSAPAANYWGVARIADGSIGNQHNFFSGAPIYTGTDGRVTNHIGFFAQSSTNARTTNSFGFLSQAQLSGAYHVSSNTASCGSGFTAGTAVDTCLYRAAANVWTFNTGTSLRVPGYHNIGSSSAPSNTAAGAFSTTKVSPPLQAFGAVTANAASGVLAFTVSTAAVTCQTATVTNTNVAASSEVILTIQSYTGTRYTNGVPIVSRSDTSGSSSGSFTLQLCNDHATNALSGNLYVAFWVLN